MAQAQTASIPYNGAGTINIHINNPSASLGGSMPVYNPMMAQYPYSQQYPYYSYPPNYYLGGLNTPITQTTNVNTPAYPYPYNQIPNSNGINNGNNGNSVNNADNNKTNTSDKTNSISEAKEKKKEREIVVLTDNYIKNLENYLKSNNTELRKDAVKELLLRFKEEQSRKDNPSLTALLNIALQDINPTIRATAMSIIQSGYAKGDTITEKILSAMQKQKMNYSTDATQAANSLLEMSKTKVKVPDNSFYTTDNKDKKKGS